MADVSQLDLNTFELKSRNRPILAVANEYKIACKRETQLLRMYLKQDRVVRKACKTDGDHHCKFFIQF